MILPMALSAEAQCIDSLIDVKGSSWRDAASRPIAGRLVKHSAPPSKITIHYTGVKKNPNLPIERKLKGLFRFSANDKTEFKKNLWGDIPYNYYVDLNGKAAEGRSPEYQPDTNTNYNPDGHVTIVVEGTIGDDLSPQQKSKLFAMIKGLQNKYNIPTSAVGTHKHYASTSCPGPVIEGAVQEYKKAEAKFRPNKNACLRPGAPPSATGTTHR